MRDQVIVYEDALVIVLAGGQGERLLPLTQHRSKPAVPFGGMYRIIDFTLSNAINSGFRKIYVLTQYKSVSLDRHIQLGWAPMLSAELEHWVQSVPPQLRDGQRWYEGTADAVYQNIYLIGRVRPKRVLVLSGDHIYKMDYAADGRLAPRLGGDGDGGGDRGAARAGARVRRPRGRREPPRRRLPRETGRPAPGPRQTGPCAGQHGRLLLRDRAARRGPDARR